MLNFQGCIACSTTACWKLGNRHVKKRNQNRISRRTKKKEVWQQQLHPDSSNVHGIRRIPMQSTICGPSDIIDSRAQRGRGYVVYKATYQRLVSFLFLFFSLPIFFSLVIRIWKLISSVLYITAIIQAHTKRMPHAMKPTRATRPVEYGST